MPKYTSIVVGFGLFIASFFLEARVSNNVGHSMVWVLRSMGVFFVVLPVLISFGKHYKQKSEEKKKSFFVKNGIKATATLLSVKRTGVFLNKVPQFEFAFKIKPPCPAGRSDNKKEFTTKTKKYIRFVDLSEIFEGMKIPAYIHPEIEGKIFLMWEEVGIGNAF